MTLRLLTLVLIAVAVPAIAQPSPAASSAFDRYAASIEGRQHLAISPQDDARLRHGDLLIERISATPNLPGVILHHWRAAAFAPNSTAADLDRLLRDFAAYPRIYAPQVLHAAAVPEQDDRLHATMRVRQRHVLTVVMDTAYDVAFTRPDPRHGSSISRSTHIAEIASPGTAAERSLTPAEDHGFLWRQNTYWTWEERDGGLSLQIESISLTRSIPAGLAWAVRPFVESVPRGSLEFTLRSTLAALCNPID